MKQKKGAIIGIGNVGASTAFTLLQSRLFHELVLIDQCHERCAGQVMDLQDAAAFNPTTLISQGSYADACAADIVIICAGKPQYPGQSRDELLAVNAQVIREICCELADISPEATVIIVTNPLDPLTYLAQKLLPLDKKRIFGTGTWLDTQRLRIAVKDHLKLPTLPNDLFMLGEHGDSACAHIPEHYNLSARTIQILQNEAIQRAYTIIDLKCATYYGIAVCIKDICKALIHDEKKTIPLSIYNTEFNICMSSPVIIGKEGIERSIQLPLSANETDLLKRSAQTINACLAYLIDTDFIKTLHN